MTQGKVGINTDGKANLIDGKAQVDDGAGCGCCETVCGRLVDCLSPGTPIASTEHCQYCLHEELDGDHYLCAPQSFAVTLVGVTVCDCREADFLEDYTVVSFPTSFTIDYVSGSGDGTDCLWQDTVEVAAGEVFVGCEGDPEYEDLSTASGGPYHWECSMRKTSDTDWELVVTINLSGGITVFYGTLSTATECCKQTLTFNNTMNCDIPPPSPDFGEGGTAVAEPS